MSQPPLNLAEADGPCSSNSSLVNFSLNRKIFIRSRALYERSKK